MNVSVSAAQITRTFLDSKLTSRQSFQPRPLFLVILAAVLRHQDSVNMDGHYRPRNVVRCIGAFALQLSTCTPKVSGK